MSESSVMNSIVSGYDDAIRFSKFIQNMNKNPRERLNYQLHHQVIGVLTLNVLPFGT